MTAVTAVGPLALVQERLARVSASLQAATGATALCRIDGAGGSAKHLEGRAAALLEARRALRRSPGEDLAPLLARWRASRDSRVAGGASSAWRDYDAGGVGELEWLIGQQSAMVDGGWAR